MRSEEETLKLVLDTAKVGLSLRGQGAVEAGAALCQVHAEPGRARPSETRAVFARGCAGDVLNEQFRKELV
jgi:hypothetical protein